MFFWVVSRKVAIDRYVGGLVVACNLALGLRSTPAKAISILSFEAFPFLQNLYPSIWAICRSHTPYWWFLGHHAVVREDGEYKRCGLSGLRELQSGA